MQPTLRRNGRHMVTVQVRAALDRLDLVNILAAESYDEATDYGERPEGQISRAGAELAVRTGLRTRGTEHWAYALDEADDAEDRRIWADTQVRRLYPEMGSS